MSANVFSQSPFLRTSRAFPLQAETLSVELDKSYVDIANAVNSRVIGIFPINHPIVTGEAWFITSGQKQQSLRQVYTFTAAGNIPHGLNWSSVAQISPKSYGSVTDGTNWYGVIFGSNVAIAGEISFYVTSTNIVVLSGAGAPAITSGIIDLEWLTLV